VPRLRHPEELLALALSRPTEAFDIALGVLAGEPSPLTASIAHQAAGIVLRDFGDIGQAVEHLRSAARLARRAADPGREADARASLGVALVMAGQPRRGLAMLDAVVSGGRGAGQARHLVRRAHVLWLLGRNTEALDDARRAVVLLRRSGDSVWLARAYNHRAMAHLALGEIDHADRDYARCEVLYSRTGQLLELASVRQERGAAAFARGDLPTALAHFDDAQQRVDELGVFEPELSVNKCAVLLAAGLSSEALAEADRAVARIEGIRGSATRRAELLHSAALAAYEVGALDVAERRCLDALRLFRRQRRAEWAARTELTLVQCRVAAGDRSAPLQRRALRVAAELDALSPERAVDAHLLAGRLALSRGRVEEGRRQLRIAAGTRRAGSRTRTTAWLARAVLAHADGRPRAMLSACDQGLRSVDLHLQAVGSTELRMLATEQRGELVRMALRTAVERRDARLLLAWSERGRATVLAARPVRPQGDSRLVADLAALRGVVSRLEAGSHLDQATATFQRERRRLESAVRQRVLQTPGTALSAPEPFDGRELLEHLAGTDLVELVDVDGELFAVVAGRRRIRMHHVGATAAADRALAHALFALRREGTRRDTRAPLDLDAIGARLETALLGGVVGDLPGAALVVVPTSRLHAIPWGLLPSLRGRPTTVVPSAAAWLRARRARPPRDARVVLVGGPRLSTGAEEVRRLARHYPQAIVLAEGTATAERVMAALDGAGLAHIAAHGTFRADSPFFSALHLDDGPLTVYDLERLRRGPHRVVLSSCNTAVGAPAGNDELIGLVSALISLGSVSVVGSVVPVDDPATVPLMVDLHRRLQDGASLPEALAGARETVRGDPVARAAADSFIALGV